MTLTLIQMIHTLINGNDPVHDMLIKAMIKDADPTDP
jgi:hypothetical protein